MYVYPKICVIGFSFHNTLSPQIFILYKNMESSHDINSCIEYREKEREDEFIEQDGDLLHT